MRALAKGEHYTFQRPCIEGIFSAVKRIFGACVHTVKKRFMYREARLKFWAYQQLLRTIKEQLDLKKLDLYLNKYPRSMRNRMKKLL